MPDCLICEVQEMMMVVREKLYTVEEFLELAQAPENETRRLELDDGVVVEIPPQAT